ncbi:MAG: hypothetical protein RIB32_02475 [Phycisphaerales bacterium]
MTMFDDFRTFRLALIGLCLAAVVLVTPDAEAAVGRTAITGQTLRGPAPDAPPNPDRNDSSGTQAHTDQPRQVSQDAEAPPENGADKPQGGDTGDDEEPEDDAKSLSRRPFPIDDLLLPGPGVQVHLPGPADPISVDAESRTLTPNFATDDPGVSFATPNGLPAPGAAVLFGIAAGFGLRRRR